MVQFIEDNQSNQVKSSIWFILDNQPSKSEHSVQSEGGSASGTWVINVDQNIIQEQKGKKKSVRAMLDFMSHGSDSSKQTSIQTTM